VAGRPLVAWSLTALAQAELVGPVVVAAPPGVEERVEETVSAAVHSPNVGFVRPARANPTVDVVAGGETRAESVQRALERVETEIVVIHDAARPLVTASLIDSVVQKLSDRPDADGVIAAAALTDTVKRARDPRGAGDPIVAKTESREHLWAAQTPQAFRTEALRAAYAADPLRLAAATDEAMLIEEAGGKVLIEPAPASNIKVTTPEDLRVAEVLLVSR
jgi:2-C-methyl-D-erythritol 4-phosphate cytidylyltransferase